MASEKQVQANRRNALNSTGPRSAEGKQRSRLNAVKHGLLSEFLLLPGEDPAALDELSAELRAELAPVGEQEELLVERMIGAAWRLRRLVKVETGIFAAHISRQRVTTARGKAAQYETSVLTELRTSGVRITDEAGHKRALAEVAAAGTLGDPEVRELGQAFLNDARHGDALSKLSRYESALERTFYTALRELERLQSARVRALPATGSEVRREAR
jgi:hypothetical protein